MAARSLLQRFLAGVSGQVYTRVAYALSTVALVPILIGAWGLQGFGEWIALTALATYFSYSNFGMVTTSANEIVMAVGAQDHLRAQQTYQMSINATFYIVLPILVALLALAAGLDVSSILNLRTVGTIGAVGILAFSVGQLWMSTIRGILVAVLYSQGSYGLAYFITGTTKFVELAVVAAAVSFFGARQVSVAGLIALVTLCDLVAVLVFARRAASWARLDFRLFDVAWIRRQIKPAVGFALANLSTQGIIVQGPRVILSIIVGPQLVAIYSVYGTAMRLVDQLLLMVALPLEIEIARSIGKGDRAEAYSLIVAGTRAGWLVFALVSVIFMVAGQYIFRLWTHGRVPFDLTFMLLFLLMSACNQVGRICAHALIATNKMYGPSLWTLAGCVLGLACGAYLAKDFGLIGMAIGIIGAELSYSVIVVIATMRWMEKRFFDYMRDAFNFFALAASLPGVLSRRLTRGEKTPMSDIQP